jgi:simple sugar transport system permease protein
MSEPTKPAGDDEPTRDDAAARDDGMPPSEGTPRDNGQISGQPSISQRFWRELLTGNALVTVLSVVLALFIAAILIVVSDPRVQDAAGYFFSRPGDTFSAAWNIVSRAYGALFSGSIVDFNEYTIGRALRPFASTLERATPLIAAGLAFAVAFRAGLFNIGVQGQLILGATFAAYVGFTFNLPIVLHVTVAVFAGLVGGALWAGIVGVLKATTGAHEVIVTIMLNNVARFLLLYLLGTAAFQRPGRQDPVSPFVSGSAELPRLIEGSRLHAGFLVAIAATFAVWWIISRSTFGFQLRAVGHNPHAATTAGMSVGRTYILVFIFAGALAGLAGASEALGTFRHLNPGVAGQLGFDAITVALLGRANPWGIVGAAILFGALRAGGGRMQAVAQVPIDIVLVVQALIVLFIVAPPLVRAIFRLKQRDRTPLVAAASGPSGQAGAL